VTPQKLLARRLCGKRGTAEVLIDVLGVSEGTFWSLLRYMRKHGYPMSMEDDGTGAIYSFFPGERVCAHEGCGTKLSAYNPTPYCSLHSRPENLPQEWFLDEWQRDEPRNEGPDKFCPDCEEVKPLDSAHFYLHNGYWDGICKPCRNKRRREHERRKRERQHD